MTDRQIVEQMNADMAYEATSSKMAWNWNQLSKSATGHDMKSVNSS